MRYLITGGGGQLASDLQELLGDSAKSFSRSELDISDPAQVDRAFESAQPDVVINCAAFHHLPTCESEPDRAWEVNVRAVRDLARRGAKLIHLSTNYVFDGHADDPYTEADTPAPRSVYAITKLAGEHAALAYGASALVVRTSGLYGLHGSASKGGNFVQRMSSRARETGELTMVADQLLQPTFTGDLAAAVTEAAHADASGIVHLTNEEACSWHAFTVAFLELQGIDAVVHEGTTTIAPGDVDRPLNGVLARPRADELGLTPLRSWRDALADYLRRAAPGG